MARHPQVLLHLQKLRHCTCEPSTTSPQLRQRALHAAALTRGFHSYNAEYGRTPGILLQVIIWDEVSHGTQHYKESLHTQDQLCKHRSVLSTAVTTEHTAAK